MKNGQITAFVILGVFVLIIAGVYLYSNYENIKGDKLSDSDIAPIKTFVESCIEEVTEPGIHLLANKGGYIYDFSNFMETESEQIAYHIDENMEVGPNKEFIEKELSRFIQESTQLCLNEFMDFPTSTIHDDIL